MKATYKFADTAFEIESCFDYFANFAKEYISGERSSIIIKTNIDQIKSWKEAHDDCESFDLDYIETLVIHSLVADKLALENKFIFHGSSIYVDNPNNTYIFTAPSGTGKSTHVRLLLKNYKDRIQYINDDKPFIYDSNEGFKVFGSPWDGKERKSQNIEGSLKGIFILKRGFTNKVTRVAPKEAINALIRQIHIPKGMEQSTNISKALVNLCMKLPIYELEVDMKDDAAKVSFEIMSKGE